MNVKSLAGDTIHRISWPPPHGPPPHLAGDTIHRIISFGEGLSHGLGQGLGIALGLGLGI